LADRPSLTKVYKPLLLNKFMDRQVVEQIDRILGQYSYNDRANLLGASGLIFDKQTKRATLVDYVPSSYLTRDKNGTCLKLTKLALEDIKREFGDSLEVRAVTGNEPRFFPEGKGLHNYLIVNSKGNSFVVDPCFRYIAPFEDSGYSVKEDLVDFSMLKGGSITLEQDDSAPLQSNSDGIIRVGLKLEKDLFKLVIAALTKDRKEHLYYYYGKNFFTHALIPYLEEPIDPVEKKVKELVENAKIL
jgi:hypothetical protein